MTYSPTCPASITVCIENVHIYALNTLKKTSYGYITELSSVLFRKCTCAADMKVLVVLYITTLAASAPLALEEEWQQWKQEHGKSYTNEVEESMRRAVWFRTYNFIQEYNNEAGNSHQLGLNAFADMVRYSVVF